MIQKNRIFLIEDAAHAHGAKVNNISAGNIGDFGCFSFYSTKIMTTGGEGGFITVNDEKYYNWLSEVFSKLDPNNNVITIVVSNRRFNRQIIARQAFEG